MHRRTFERAMERIYRAEEIVEWHSDQLLDRLNRLGSAPGRGRSGADCYTYRARG